MNSIRHTQEQLYVTPKIGYVDCDAYIRSEIQLLIPGQYFLETFTLLPETTRTTNSWVTTSFLSLTNKHDFCYTYGDISHSHIQQCLNLTMHILLLSQLYNNSMSFPYFFPSYDTCSINVNPLFHAAIKNHHKNLTASLYFSLIYLPLKLCEEVNNVTNT